MKRCDECVEVFKWDDDVVNIGDRCFHRDCVELVPSSYVAFVNGEFIGEVEYEDSAYLILNDGDYLEGEK